MTGWALLRGMGLGAATGLALGGEAMAQATPSPLQTFPAEFFQPFHPDDALDMLERAPGFTIDFGDEIRGLGGASGNVLIDGVRPAAKSGGVEEALERIPAARVEAIELIDGAQVPDARGRVLFANVRLRRSAGGSGAWSLSAKRAPDGELSPELSVTYARAGGVWRTEAGLEAERWTEPLSARHRFDEDGAPAPAWAEQRAGYRGWDLSTSGSASRGLAGGDLSLTARFERETGDGERRIAGPDAGAVELNAGRWSVAGFEAGAEWGGPIGQALTGKLVALLSGGRDDENETDRSELDGAMVEQAQARSRQTSGELVLRGAIRREGRLDLEVGAEAALNGLDSRLSYAVDDGGGLEEVDLPAADVRVREYRGEGFVNLGADIGPRLRLDAALAVEASRLSVRGDVAETQSFVFWKPSVAVTYSRPSGLRLALGLQEKVGQLDFENFAASVDTEDDQAFGGNPALLPERALRLYADLTRPFGDGGALSVVAFHEWRRDVLEYALLPSGAEGLANVGEARAWGVTWAATIPLGGLWKGARLEFTGEALDAVVDDPVTGRPRQVNQLDPLEFAVRFRSDRPDLRLSWGVTYESPQRIRSYYLGTVLEERWTHRLSGFVETTRLKPLKLTLEVEGINNETEEVWRAYDPDRGGPASGAEHIVFDRGVYVTLTASRTF